VFRLRTVVNTSEDLSYLDAYPTVQTLSSPRACACGCGQALSLFSGILSSVFASNRGVIRIVRSLPPCIVEALIMIASMSCWDSPGTGTIHSGVTRRPLQHPLGSQGRCNFPLIILGPQIRELLTYNCSSNSVSRRVASCPRVPQSVLA